MAQNHSKILALVVMCVAMIGPALPAIQMSGQDIGKQSESDNDRASVPGHLILTVRYMEFDLLDDQMLFETINRDCRVRRADPKELIEQLTRRGRLIKELQAVVPPGAHPRGVVEETDPSGESMLRVQLTSAKACDDGNFAIKGNLERWDNREGKFWLKCGVHQREFYLKPSTWKVAGCYTSSVIDLQTNKAARRRIELWIMYLSSDALADTRHVCQLHLI